MKLPGHTIKGDKLILTTRGHTRVYDFEECSLNILWNASVPEKYFS